MSHPADPQIFHTPPRLPSDQAFSSTTNLSDLSSPDLPSVIFTEISSPRLDCEFFFSVKAGREKKNGDGIFSFFFPCIYGEKFFSTRRERERERAFHSRIPRQIRKRLFALMRADKILRIPENPRSLVGCNAVVSLVLSPLGFRYVCVSRNYRRTVESNVNERCERMEFKRYTHNSVGFYLRENPH